MMISLASGWWGVGEAVCLAGAWCARTTDGSTLLTAALPRLLRLGLGLGFRVRV